MANRRESKMSLICAECGRTIVLSGNPDHYGICCSCPMPISDEAKQILEEDAARKARGEWKWERK
jgi:hypothetical protein